MPSAAHVRPNAGPRAQARCRQGTRPIALIFALLCALLLRTALWAEESAWQPARIVEVSHRVETKTQAWVVNTPINKDEVVCTITVHLGERMVSGSYVVNDAHPVPPPDWVANRPVEAQMAGDWLLVRSSATTEVRARIAKRKRAHALPPWSKDETADFQAAFKSGPSPLPTSMIGFDKRPSETSASPDTQANDATPAAPEPATGAVSISSVPYLAEVFVDGQSTGYTPTKLQLPPGKHSIRCEKAGYRAWSQDIQVTAGTELALDATLQRK